MWLKVAACVLGVLAMKEFLSLPHKNKRPMYVDIIIYALTILLIFMDGKREIYYLLTILVPMLLVIYCNDNKKYNADEAFKLIGMTFLVGTVFHKFLEIREESLMLFIYLFLIINDLISKLPPLNRYRKGVCYQWIQFYHLCFLFWQV